MEPVRSRIKWKGVVVAMLALALLALLLWLFLRPGQPARDIVFGDLGRRPVANNAVADGRPGAVPDVSGDVVSGAGQIATNAPSRNEPFHDHNDQGAGRTAPAPLAAQPGPGMAPGDSASGLPATPCPKTVIRLLLLRRRIKLRLRLRPAPPHGAFTPIRRLSSIFLRRRQSRRTRRARPPCWRRRRRRAGDPTIQSRPGPRTCWEMRAHSRGYSTPRPAPMSYSFWIIR